MKFNIYIPTLNAEKTIEQCISSVLEISKNVYVIDSGSTDNTLNLVKKYKIKILNKKAKHLANARNIALNHCKTEFIGFIDADVLVSKDWFKHITKHFNKRNVVGVGGKLIEKNTKSLPDKWRSFHLKQHWGNNLIKNPEFLFGSNTIFKISALKKVNGYNEKYKTNYEDVDISNKLKKSGYHLVYEPKAVCYHLKKDILISVIKTARNWSFFSYDLPNNFINLVKRIVLYNPYLFVNYLIKDILNFKLSLVLITTLTFFYNQFFDLNYFIKHT